MKIAVCSDEPYPLHNAVIDLLQQRGHQVVKLGSVASQKDEPWADVALDAARRVANGECDEGIFFCWTGTGISMAANKVPGIRAALCIDAQTAEGARIWNHANVLCMSNRLVSQPVALEIVEAWLHTPYDERGAEAVKTLSEL